MPPEPTPVDPTTLGAMGYIDLRALDFARQQPPDMPASEVVARAAEQGLQLHPNDVHRLRERDRARAEKARFPRSTP